MLACDLLTQLGLLVATLAATLHPDPSRNRAAHLRQAGLQPPELARHVLVQLGLPVATLVAT